MWLSIGARTGLSTDWFNLFGQGHAGLRLILVHPLSLALRMDRLAALEHRDKILDLLLSSSLGFHIERAKRQRKPILRAELRQHRSRLGFGIDRGLQVAGDLAVLA